MNTMFAAFLGGTELVVIGVVALVLFGSKKIPEFMKGLGTGIKEFKKASNDVQNEMERAANEEPPPPPKMTPPANTQPVQSASTPPQPVSKAS